MQQTISFEDLPQYESLVQMLEARAGERPDGVAARFLGDGGRETERGTYGELSTRARRIAAQLRQLAEPGERVLLFYPPGLEYIATFFGCLYTGVLAVPAYPCVGQPNKDV